MDHGKAARSMDHMFMIGGLGPGELGLEVLELSSEKKNDEELPAQALGKGTVGTRQRGVRELG